ncbi:unnamed protein product, partial [Amoebophrya sp. A25]
GVAVVLPQYYQQKSSSFLEAFHSVALTGDLKLGQVSLQTAHAVLGRSAYDFTKNRLQRVFGESS